MQTLRQLLGGQLLALEIFLQQSILGFGHVLHEIDSHLVGPFLKLRGYVFLGLLAVIVRAHRLHADQVDDPAEALAVADGELHVESLDTQPLRNGIHRLHRIRLFAVHAVDEKYARHSALRGVAPKPLRLYSQAGAGVEHEDRAAESRQ